MFVRLLILLLGSLPVIAKKTSHPALTAQQVVALFPATVEQIQSLARQTIAGIRTSVDQILAIKPRKRTFANTCRKLDAVIALYLEKYYTLIRVTELYPDKDMRDAAQKASLELSNVYIDLVSSNQKLYNAIKEYMQWKGKKEKLSEEEHRFINEIQEKFKRQGLDLPPEKIKVCKELQKDIERIGLQLTDNIRDGQRSITVSRAELAGMDDDFIAALKQDGKDSYVLNTDYPTFFPVMEHCSVESTRHKFWLAFLSRAYPENESVVVQLIAKRNELAKLLGYKNFAEYDIANTMAHSVTTVSNFLAGLVEPFKAKYSAEFKQLSSDLPPGVTLTADGKLNPWDEAFVRTQFKKKHYDFDERKLAEYFPMEKTIRGLLTIYERFMDIKMEPVKATGLWHEDVQMVVVHDAKKRLRGYIIFDLHPRPNKYAHAAGRPIVFTTLDSKKNPTPAVAVVMANFPKSTATKPALMEHADVETFFHEFGHAIHVVLGSTEMAYFSGAHESVKQDFIELPSQMLEHWMWDPKIMKMIGSHYKTGEPLPDELIEKKIALRNFGKGYWLIRQLMIGSFSLEFFLGRKNNPDAITKKYYEQLMVHSAYDPGYHFAASFGHLIQYGPKYYGYLWSQVFASDVFAKIKKYGLLNPKIGREYVNTILSKGGSVDPNKLLEDFLGRKPNQKAFFKDLGLAAQ